MRLGHVLALTRMLLIFFTRKVLRLGVLRSRPVRVLAITGAALLLAGGVAGAWAFLRSALGDARSWELLFDLSTVSVVLWSQMAFLLVKVLFLNADGLLDLSFHLPLTNRERALAFLVYEAAMAGAVASVGFASVVGAALLLRGPAAVLPVLEAVVLPMLLTYAAMTVLHLALGRVLVLLGLRRLRQVALILSTFALLLAYASQLSVLANRISENYLTGRADHVWVTILAQLARTRGAPVMLAIALGVLAVLVALAVWLTPNEHVRHSRFVNVPGRRLAAALGPYDLCFVRSTQTWLSAALSGALFAALWISDAAHPLWGLALLSLGGLYQFAQTSPLRHLAHGEDRPWAVFARLLRAPVGSVLAAAVPATLLLAAFAPDRLAGALPTFAGAAGSAVVAICIGVIFPAENDNPFSVFIGLAVTAVVFGLVGISLGILQASPVVTSVVVLASLSVLSWYSIQAIRIDESRRRNEEVIDRRERTRRWRAADPRGRRVNAALSHVVDR